ARGMDAVGPVAYVADGMDGVYLIRNDLAPSDVLDDGTDGLGDAVTSNRMLLGNSPNPFTESTQVRFRLQEASDVRLAVIDVAGRRVALRQFASMPPGMHEITLDGSGLPSGAYRYVLQAGTHVESGRMLRVR
ncbi:MAG: T9SS type A sorting domain-containing protein, partial [Candidatus Eisenbacteria bacterium]|nr:T9SS type A sorting domain-containing protein [Candidatus Eisenbacteria bacterium]